MLTSLASNLLQTSSTDNTTRTTAETPTSHIHTCEKNTNAKRTTRQHVTKQTNNQAQKRTAKRTNIRPNRQANSKQGKRDARDGVSGLSRTKKDETREQTSWLTGVSQEKELQRGPRPIRPKIVPLLFIHRFMGIQENRKICGRPSTRRTGCPTRSSTVTSPRRTGCREPHPRTQRCCVYRKRSKIDPPSGADNRRKVSGHFWILEDHTSPPLRMERLWAP